MGVPAFFRYLSDKCEKIVTPAAEDPLNICNGVMVPLDTSQPNPNGIEYDNLYLDMNGIIHPCCHPDDRPAPATEDEMIGHIFQYIDRVFSIVRPRKLLYMAIDGVAPRAKMNQQRSRRFRAAKEAEEKEIQLEELNEQMIRDGMNPPDKKEAGFDSNCITPGTEFMAHLANCLQYYVHERMNTDPGWRKIKVILSDATVPGEGEHKVIDFIRKQRANPAHNPNTMHCLYGADADLIFLSLATHEPHFHVLREDVKPAYQKPCYLCGQMGHTKEFCTGQPKEKSEPEGPIHMDKEFVMIKINVLREYLASELLVEGLPFTFDLERAIDDWVFICFFVGNDFLPHMPSLEIREGAIDRLVAIWKRCLPRLGGYLTLDGTVDCKRVQVLFQELGQAEDEIFKERKIEEDNMKERRKRRKQQDQARREAEAKFLELPQYQPVALGSSGHSNVGLGQAIKQHRETQYQSQSTANQEVANQLRQSLSGATANESSSKSGQVKRKHEEEQPEPNDEVRLWEEGWKARYYQAKFGVDVDDIAFRTTVVRAYMEGLCWVLAYYYQGCATWNWFYPFHYSPFASDIAECDVPQTVSFERNTVAFNPLEQLMGVLPAVSGKRFLPPAWSKLMYDPKSPIIDFYPKDFKIDLNGKPMAWMGVALLPFIDEKRLFESLATVRDDLTDDEKERNKTGNDFIFVSCKHPLYESLCSLYEYSRSDTDETKWKPLTANQGMTGSVAPHDNAVLPGSTFYTPLPDLDLPDINDNQVIGVLYRNPEYTQDTVHHAKLLPGVTMPAKVTTKEDLDLAKQGGRRGRGRGRGRGGGRGRGERPEFTPADRMIRNTLNMGLLPGPNMAAPHQDYGFVGHMPLAGHQPRPGSQQLPLMGGAPHMAQFYGAGGYMPNARPPPPLSRIPPHPTAQFQPRPFDNRGAYNRNWGPWPQHSQSQRPSGGRYPSDYGRPRRY